MVPVLTTPVWGPVNPIIMDCEISKGPMKSLMSGDMLEEQRLSITTHTLSRSKVLGVINGRVVPMLLCADVVMCR